MNTDNSASTTPESNPANFNARQSRLISKVLSPAVRLWLRSQVQQVSNLEVQISGSDRQLLTGYIPCVSVSACHAVYQGLHLSQIQLLGENIRTNLGQVIKGQPLRLLEPISVFGELLLQESDLNASLKSPLLADALTQLLGPLLADSHPSTQISWHKITIDNTQLIIEATLAPDTTHSKKVVIRTGLQLVSSHELLLEHLQLETQGSSVARLDSFTLDLGAEVAMTELTLSLGQLVCCGQISVNP